MSEVSRNWDEEFENILVFNASIDPKVRQYMNWVLAGQIDTEFHESPDYYRLTAHIRDNWGLAGDGADRAIEMCEEDLTKRLRPDG